MMFRRTRRLSFEFATYHEAISVSVASKTTAGDDIPSQPTDGSGDPLEIPAVSSDGSHILIAAGGVDSR